MAKSGISRFRESMKGETSKRLRKKLSLIISVEDAIDWKIRRIARESSDMQEALMRSLYTDTKYKCCLIGGATLQRAYSLFIQLHPRSLI